MCEAHGENGECESREKIAFHSFMLSILMLGKPFPCPFKHLPCSLEMEIQKSNLLIINLYAALSKK